MITPIFKSGNRSDPSNYRGICVSSCLGKLFCCILNTRLSIYFYDQNINFYTLPRLVFYLNSEQQIISLPWELLLINTLRMKTEVNCSVVSSTSKKRLTRYGMMVHCQNQYTTKWVDNFLT